jgi:hypothetical protein
MKIPKFHVDQIKNMAGDLNKTAQNTLSLLDDILTWAGTQQGKIPFIPQNLCFEDVCQDAIELHKPNASVKKKNETDKF